MRIAFGRILAARNAFGRDLKVWPDVGRKIARCFLEYFELELFLARTNPGSFILIAAEFHDLV